MNHVVRILNHIVKFHYLSVEEFDHVWITTIRQGFSQLNFASLRIYVNHLCVYKRSESYRLGLHGDFVKIITKHCASEIQRRYDLVACYLCYHKGIQFFLKLNAVSANVYIAHLLCLHDVASRVFKENYEARTHIRKICVSIYQKGGIEY